MMIAYDISTLALASTNALQRWQGARETPPWYFGWQWIVTALGVVAGLIALRIVLIGRMRKSILREAEERYARDKTLSTAELELLTKLIQQSGLTRSEPRFALEQAFNIGVGNYLNSDQFNDLSEEIRFSEKKMISQLRDKLGIELETAATDYSTSLLPVGTQLILVDAEPFEHLHLEVEHNDEDAFLVKVSPMFECRPNQSLLLRYYDGDQVWQISTQIIDIQPDTATLVLQHDPEMKTVNVRRFNRVPVRQRGLVSRFEFHAADNRLHTPNFAGAIITEIAGPGLLLQSDLAARVGDRLAIIMELAAGKVFQGVGRVRRAGQRDGRGCYGVELIDLKPTQVAELMSITNAAAIERKKGNAPQSTSSVA
jgi:hypothetical protein